MGCRPFERPVYGFQLPTWGNGLVVMRLACWRVLCFGSIRTTTIYNRIASYKDRSWSFQQQKANNVGAGLSTVASFETITLLVETRSTHLRTSIEKDRKMLLRSMEIASCIDFSCKRWCFGPLPFWSAEKAFYCCCRHQVDFSGYWCSRYWSAKSDTWSGWSVTQNKFW